MLGKGKKVISSAVCVLFVLMALNFAFIPSKAYAAETTLFPRAGSAPDTNIDAIDMRNASLDEWFLVASLQGLVNREKPRIFVISRPIVDDHTIAGGNAQFDDGDTEFWLDKLAAQGYTRNDYSADDKYELVRKYSSTLSGCIIYDPEIVQYTGEIIRFKPSDANMATINVTAMLCAKYNAIALTEEQRNTLKNDYGVELDILFDTTDQWDTWDAAMNYAYDNLREDMRKDIIAHVPTFYFGMMDYVIQNKIFTYHRVRPSPTSAQNAMENSILAMTADNTPVIGVWQLYQDEGGLVDKVSRSGKFFTVTHESFNLSWTSGLPVPALRNTPKRDIALDPAKIYVACTVTEGDNATYDIMSMQTTYDKESRTAYPMGWELTTTMMELAPNVASYYYDNLGNNYIVCPVSGVGYVNPISPDSNRAGFYDLTDKYMKAADTEIVRTLFDSAGSAGDYTKIPGVKGVLRGYLRSDGGIAYTNGKPVFGSNDFDSRKSAIKSYSGTTPAFFSIAMDGWKNPSDHWKEWCDTLPSNFEVVTPAELAELYTEYITDYLSNTKMVTASSSYEKDGWGTAMLIDGQRSSVAGSMGWSSDSNTKVDHTEWIKLCLGSVQTINRVDLYPRDDGDEFADKGYGFPIDFTIQVSTDDANWTTVAEETDYPKTGGEVQSFTFDSRSAKYIKIEGTRLPKNESDPQNPYRMQLAEIEALDDTPAPSLTTGAAVRISDTEASVTFTSDKAGQYYYAVAADGAGEPVINTSGAGVACTAGETTITNPSGLSAGAMDIYIKVKDAAGKVSNVLMIDIPAYTTEGRPFVIVTSGELDRSAGIKAEADVGPASGTDAHEGKETVVFRLMKGTTPVNIVAVEKDITSEETFTAYFNVSDPQDGSYTVKVFVFDTFGGDMTAPANLAEPAALD